MDDWAIYIDIEGFSALYPEGNEALWALRKLMLAIHRIGKRVYPESPDRLFAYQLGDGFLITSDVHEENLERAVSIAIVLMKFITCFNVFARAAIAEGGLAGIVGCYENEVINEALEGDNATVFMGSGIMTIFPVMGTALINAVGIDKTAPKGPILTLPKKFSTRLPNHIIFNIIENTQYIAIDWVHTESDLINKIKTMALLEFPRPENLEILLSKYLAKRDLPEGWAHSCHKYMGIKMPNKCVNGDHYFAP